MPEKRNNWSREETILAFELYCTIPSSKVTDKNPQIIELANAIGRGANSIKLKLQNFKSYDPSYTQDGRIGLSHGSHLDEKIVTEFLQNWDSLVLEADEIKRKYNFETDSQSVNSFKDETNTSLLESVGYDKISSRKIRIGQNFFRKTLMSAYNGKCCITGLAIPDLLIASHIKPWSKSNDINEKTNPQNGLLLNALHDAAFDRGYITIDPDEHKIIISDRLSDYTDEFTEVSLKKYSGKELTLPNKLKPDKKFIKYHNDVIFLK